MADQQGTIEPIDSSELFEAAISNEPVEQEAVQVAESTEQPRDEGGRFAAKTEAAPAATTNPPPADPGKEEANVPSWRLREISEERRQAQTERDAARHEAAQFRAEMEQMRRQLTQQTAPKPEPVDIFADPSKWAEQTLSPIEQRLQAMNTSMVLRASRAENFAIHGREAVAAAEKALDEAVNSRDPDIPGLQAKLIASDDPVGVMMDWHKSRSLLKETGGDLNAYRQKVLEEALSDPAYQAKVLEAARAQANGGQTQPKSIVKLPPSLNKIAASAGNDAADTDMSDGALFAHAMR